MSSLPPSFISSRLSQTDSQRSTAQDGRSGSDGVGGYEQPIDAKTAARFQIRSRIPLDRNETAAGTHDVASSRYRERQMGHQAALRPALDSAGPEASAVTFERVLNTEEAAALLQIHPKTLQKMAREGTVPAFRIGDLWRFRASALDEWLSSGVCSKRHSCR